MHVFIYSACSILLNFLIYSQLIAEMGCSVAEARAYGEESSIGTRAGISTKVGISARVDIDARVGIGAKVGIGASFSKDAFTPS
jgi:UDP-3-O-[3-hydroxymyristoyl] glucosamine N-acyltransferase